ncbi:hypothetical protein G9A89_023982 [Geosiphon pyriformis]|nr:hypothetical protein G9A89_023982 [Geosiphon pyriformis]
MESRFFMYTGKLDLRTSKMFFMAAEAFVDNTIWIENSMAATQILWTVFLAGVMNTLLSYGLSLGSSVTNMFCAGSSIVATDVLGLNAYIKILLDHHGRCFMWNLFRRWKRLDLRRPTFGWFVSLVNFIESGSLVGSSILLQLSSSKFCSYDDGYVKDCLGHVGSDIIHVYTDSSVKDLGSSGACGGAAVYFSSVNIGVGVRSDFTGPMCNSLTKPQTRFQKKMLDRVDHTGVVGNECTNFFTEAATGSNFILPVKMSLHFLSIKDRPIFDNAYYVVSKLYDAVNLYCIFDVWHPNGYVKSGYTGSATTILHLYFMKALHYWLPVAKRKRLYYSGYPSVLCILCELLKDLDHSFVCVSNANTHNDLISDAIKD